MQKLVYVPPGANQSEGVVLTTAEPYILSTISGVGGVEASILSADIAGMDGTYMQGVHIEPREIPCTVYVHGTNRAGMYRKRFELIGKLTPQQKCGKLYYTNDGLGKELVIDAVPRLPPDFGERIKTYNKADISFYCPCPFWSDTAGQVIKVGFDDEVGFRLPFEFGTITFGNLTNRQVIYCNSSVPIPMEITFAGPAEAPSITNVTTGDTLRLSDIIIQAGERLIINTQRGAKSVTFINNKGQSSNAFQYITPDSVFLSLVPGRNELLYQGGVEKTKVYIKYTNRYAGI